VLAMRVEAEALEGGAARCERRDLSTGCAASRVTPNARCGRGNDADRPGPRFPNSTAPRKPSAALWRLDPTHGGLIDLYEHVGRQPGHERAPDRSRCGCAPSCGRAHRSRARGRRHRGPHRGPGAGGVAASSGSSKGTAPRARTSRTCRGRWGSRRVAGVGGRPAARRRTEEAGLACRRSRSGAARLEFDVARIAGRQAGGPSRWRPKLTKRCTPPTRRIARRGSRWSRSTGGSETANKLADLLASVIDYVEDLGERAHLRLERVRTMMQSMVLEDADAAPLLAREIVDEDAGQVDAALMLAGILERTGAPRGAGGALRAANRRGEGPERRTLGRVAGDPARRPFSNRRSPRRRARRITRGWTGNPRAGNCSRHSWRWSARTEMRRNARICWSADSRWRRDRRPKRWPSIFGQRVASSGTRQRRSAPSSSASVRIRRA